MKKIGVLANFKRDRKAVRRNVIFWLEMEGTEVVVPDRDYDVTDQSFLCDFMQKKGQYCDGLIVMGGDGTMLAVARQAAHYHVPIFGINTGHIGFLAEVEPDSRLYPSLKRLLKDDYVLEERMMLRVRVYRGEELFREYHCLNDCVVTKKSFDGLVNIAAYVDGKHSLSYSGDGLIVATPTGASGYSLSAGGPLVSPEMDAMILTPVSAHCLYCRSIVIDANREITLKADREEGRCVLCIDGKTATLLISPKDRICIEKSEMTTGFIRLNDRSFFQVLNEKLRERS